MAAVKAELQALFADLGHKEKSVRDDAAGRLQRAVGVGMTGIPLKELFKVILYSVVTAVCLSSMLRFTPPSLFPTMPPLFYGHSLSAQQRRGPRKSLATLANLSIRRFSPSSPAR